MLVNNTNLWAKLKRADNRVPVIAKSQGIISLWGKNINVTGGVFNTDKCHIYLYKQVPVGEGGWEYITKEQHDEWETIGYLDKVTSDGIGFTVPQNDRTAATIKILLVD